MAVILVGQPYRCVRLDMINSVRTGKCRRQTFAYCREEQASREWDTNAAFEVRVITQITSSSECQALRQLNDKRQARTRVSVLCAVLRELGSKGQLRDWE